MITRKALCLPLVFTALYANESALCPPHGGFCLQQKLNQLDSVYQESLTYSHEELNSINGFDLYRDKNFHLKADVNECCQAINDLNRPANREEKNKLISLSGKDQTGNYLGNYYADGRLLECKRLGYNYCLNNPVPSFPLISFFKKTFYCVPDVCDADALTECLEASTSSVKEEEGLTEVYRGNFA